MHSKKNRGSRPACSWSVCASSYLHRSHFGSRYQSGRCALRSSPFAPRGFESHCEHFSPILVILCKTANAFALRERYDACIRKKIAGHVRRAHGAFVRPHIFTVAILAQGTNRGDALCAALLLRRVGSNPTATTFRFWTFSSILRPQTSDILCNTVYER